MVLTSEVSWRYFCFMERVVGAGGLRKYHFLVHNIYNGYRLPVPWFTCFPGPKLLFPYTWAAASDKILDHCLPRSSEPTTPTLRISLALLLLHFS